MHELLQWAWFYPTALALLSVGVALLERVRPARASQPVVRSRLWSDVLHLIFNGHVLGVVLYAAGAAWLAPPFDAWLDTMGWTETFYRSAAEAWPVWVQIPIALLVIDVIHWCIHNLLHRIPALWQFHKTHHSVQADEMDWIVAFRFQWTEVVVYKLIQFAPLAWLGFGLEAVMFHAVLGTLIGHLNHANVDLDYGPLRYVFNSPSMHLWHHAHPEEQPQTVNFGIIFSIWDWVFGTAHLPDQPPQRLGFPGDETFPPTWFEHQVWPVSRVWQHHPKHRLISGVLGAGLVASVWVLVA